MQIYEKNRWLLKNEELTIRALLGKDKLSRIKKGIQEFEDISYIFSVKKMNPNDLEDFFTLYQSFISQKENGYTHDLITKYQEKMKLNQEVHFGFLRDENQNLLGGGIFTFRYDDTLKSYITVLGFRAYNTEITFGKLKIGYFIEYLFYKWSLEDMKPDFLSRGHDRNAYGFLGSNPGLAIHKLQGKFLPFKAGNIIEIEEDTIKTDTLIFTDPGNNGLYKKALIYTTFSEEKIIEKYGLISKRGIDLVIKPLN